MAIPEKYSHIDFTPPAGVQKDAEYGLKLRREHGRGGTAVGIARARDLSNGSQVSPSTIRRMKAFFDRHQSDSSAPGFKRGDKEYPSNGLIANKLWGGSAGYSWASKVVDQMNAADENESRGLRPHGSSMGLNPSIFVVHGPPSSKKAEYVADKMGDNDVVFDYQKIMWAMSGDRKNDNLISYCTDIRSLIIDKALRSPSVERTWVITTRVKDEMRGKLSDVHVSYVYIDTPKEECLREIEGLSNEEELRKVIEDYFAEAESRYSPTALNVERRFLGNFAAEEKIDPELLRVERRADPTTGKPRTYLVGYAARFQTDSLLLGDFIERIDPAAFDLVEQRQDSEGRPLETRCLYNHDPNHLLGRFPTTMRLTVDKKGLRYECLLPESRADLAESIERGDLRGSSFSFVVADGGEKWTYENGRSIRLVTKIKSLLDCGPVTYPAYGDATVAVAKRSYQQFLEERAFCKTGSGGGIDNSCGKEGSPPGEKESETKKNIDKAAKKEKGYEAKRKSSFADAGARIGLGVGMGIGVIGGLTGIAIGGVIGGLAGGYMGMMLPNPSKIGVVKAWKPFAKKKSSRSNAGASSVEELAASLGVDEESIKSAIATAADSDTAKGGVAATDKGSLVITVSGLSSFMVLSPGNPWLNQQSASLFVGSPDSADRVRLCEIAAASLGAKSIAVGKASPGVVSELLKAGYKQTADGVVVKDVAGMKNRKSKRSYEQLIEFFSERRKANLEPASRDCLSDSLKRRRG